jgi:hypothetical protein
MVQRLFMWMLLLSAPGCLWRSYATIMKVHLDVLTQTADKLESVVRAGRGVSAESMAEYVYPAQRGREFLRQFNQDSGRPSYQQFAAFLDQYEAMVHDVDAQRAQGNDWQTVLPGLAQECEALRQRAQEIRHSLQSEG